MKSTRLGLGSSGSTSYGNRAGTPPPGYSPVPFPVTGTPPPGSDGQGLQSMPSFPPSVPPPLYSTGSPVYHR